MTDRDVRHFLTRVCVILNKHDVDYLVIGGAAVNYYGYNRVSRLEQKDSKMKADLDFWYRPTIGNFSKLIKALAELEVDTTDLKELTFDPKRTFLKIPHDEFQTDFLPIMEGIAAYKECKARAETVEIDNTKINVISYDDLIANKKAINREMDQEDIKSLEATRKNKLKILNVDKEDYKFNRDEANER
jgi:predicted nucleotidyltransferase